MPSCGPVSASTDAHWLIVDGAPVEWLRKFDMIFARVLFAAQ